MRRRKDVSNRSASFTYQLRRHDDVSAWSATSRPIWELIETSLRRLMPGGATHSNHLKKQDRNFASLVALIFLRDMMFYCLIFHLPNFLIALFNLMIGSSHAQLCKKSSCSVKLQGGPFDHNPRYIPVKDSWIIILQNNSKCVLLNNKQMPHKILFSLLGEIQNIIKMNTRESKERKFETKVREIGRVILIFI